MKILICGFVLGLLLFGHQGKKARVVPLDGFYKLDRVVSNESVAISQIEVITLENGRKYICTHAKYTDVNGHTLYHDELFPVANGVFHFEGSNSALGKYTISGSFVSERKAIGIIKIIVEDKITNIPFQASLGF